MVGLPLLQSRGLVLLPCRLAPLANVAIEDFIILFFVSYAVENA